MQRPLASRATAMIVSLALSGCALFHHEGLPPPPGAQVGVASWYGSEFHGRRTASGARFDEQGLTAAHPTLPLGTRVRVTNLENDRSVVVLVNDRGPYVDRRLIDVSRGAARRLGMLEAGTARVRLTALEDGATTPVDGQAVVEAHHGRRHARRGTPALRRRARERVAKSQ